jgi:deoxyribose-phosphate aldolase
MTNTGPAINIAFDPVQTARTALACLDLTSLNDADTPADIEALCRKAIGPTGRGPTAAVCVWPRFVAQARKALPANIAVAAVANFPDGGTDIDRAVRDTLEIVDAGGDEVDVVIPYRALDSAPALLAAVRAACPQQRLKVILETGELADDGLIARACSIALDAGADFLKTSTGKVKVNATPHSAGLLLKAIAAREAAQPATGKRVGFKPAGGVRTVADAAVYIALVAQHLGAAAVSPQRLRIGASGLLGDIEAVLGGGSAASAPSSSY